MNFMKFSNSGGASANAKTDGVLAAQPTPSPRTSFASWMINNAESGLYVLYILLIVLMLGCYFLNLPIERAQFYRRSAMALRTVAVAIAHGSRPQPTRPAMVSRSTKSVIPVGQLIVGYLDQVEGRPAISVRAGDKVLVSGWAGCRNAPSRVADVELMVGNDVKAIAARSFPRPDVAETFGRPDFANSGWKGSFDTKSLPEGSYPITARVTCTTGESNTLPPFVLAVKEK